MVSSDDFNINKSRARPFEKKIYGKETYSVFGMPVTAE